MASAPEQVSACQRGVPADRAPAFLVEGASRRAWHLSLLFSAATLICAAFRLPTDLGFDANAFGDRGDFLSINYLVSHGSRPAVDFGYHWGLLPVALGRVWFLLFGATPRANAGIMLVCALVVAVGFARIAATVQLRATGISLILVSLPFWFPIFTLTYALEAGILSNALAEQAAQRRPRALALATAACFVNPSMGYFYGLTVLFQIIHETRRRSLLAGASNPWPEILRATIPAAATGAVLLVILGAIFGPLSAVKTILPIAGIQAHRNQASGFFYGVGREFWYQPQLGLRFYLFTVVGFWLAASVWLIISGLQSGRRLLSKTDQRGSSAMAAELVLTCAVLHVAFVTVFFGSAVSWRYYCYILVLGVSATSIRGRISARITGALAVIAFLGNTAHNARIIEQWRTTAPRPEMSNMWATPTEAREWKQVGDAIDGHRALMLTAMGCGPLLSDKFEAPFANHFTPGELMPGQLARLYAEMRGAQRIMVVTSPGFGNMLVWWPEIRSSLDKHELLLKGQTFSVYGPLKQNR